MDLRGFAVAAAAFVSGSACAMSASPPRDLQCTVERGDVLPAGSGGAEALCADIKEAAAAAGAKPTSVSVRVVSAYSMAATITVGGKVLPVLHFDRMDRELSRSAFRSFAQSIASVSAAAQGD